MNVYISRKGPISIQKNECIYLWDSIKEHNPKKNIFSIPYLANLNAKKYKDIFLTWLYSLHDRDIFSIGMSIRDATSIGNSGSIWWMSSVFERCNLTRSQYIDDIIKTLALLDNLKEKNIKKIYLLIENKPVQKTLLDFSKKNNISLVYTPQKTRKFEIFSLTSLKNLIPIYLKGWLWILYYFSLHINLKKLNLQEWQKNESEITFFTFTSGIFSIKDTNRFSSVYWQGVPNLLDKLKIKTRWVHIYNKSKGIEKSSTASSLLRKFTLSSDNNEVHVSLDHYLSIKVLFRSLKDWSKIRSIIGPSPRRRTKLPCLADTDFTFFFINGLIDSTIGRLSLENILIYNLFNELISSIKIKQKLGIYLYENQPWEYALIQCWKNNGHKYIVGHLHSTYRLWDFRYGFPNSSSQKNIVASPLPDYIAVNGDVCFRAFSEYKFLKNRLIKVEALRYQYLSDARQKRNLLSDRLSNDKLKITILGDYSFSRNDSLIEIIYPLLDSLLDRYEVIFKPHPSRNDHVDLLRKAGVTIFDGDINDLLIKTDLVITTSSTSASVDAYDLRIPVIIVSSGSELNQSPLLGILNEDFFVESTDGLKMSIEKVLAHDEKNSFISFFSLDNELPKWRGLLSLRVNCKDL